VAASAPALPNSRPLGVLISGPQNRLKSKTVSRAGAARNRLRVHGRLRAMRGRGRTNPKSQNLRTLTIRGLDQVRAAQ
jgi:hypothetical protein